MSKKNLPKSFFQLPIFRFWEDIDEDLLKSVPSSDNLSLSENENNVFIEAALPGLKEEDIEASIENGLLWIRGEKKEEEEDKKKKYYRKMSRSFSYTLPVPQNIDDNAEPDAKFQDGILKITFKKTSEGKSKKILFKK